MLARPFNLTSCFKVYRRSLGQGRKQGSKPANEQSNKGVGIGIGVGFLQMKELQLCKFFLIENYQICILCFLEDIVHSSSPRVYKAARHDFPARVISTIFEFFDVQRFEMAKMNTSTMILDLLELFGVDWRVQG